MKKFLTVLLALSVVFTYSFSAVGSVFAAEYTFEDYSKALTAEKTAQLEYLANAKKQAVNSYTYGEDGFAEGTNYMKAAYEAAADEVISDLTKSMDNKINEILNTEDLSTLGTPAEQVSEIRDICVNATTADGMKTALAAKTDTLNKVQAPLTKASVEGKLNVDLSKYDSKDKKYDVAGVTGKVTAAQAVQIAIDKAKDAIKAADAKTDNADKIEGYKKAGTDFEDAMADIKTIADEEFSSGIVAGTVDAAVEEYAKVALDELAGKLAINPDMKADDVKDWSALVGASGDLNDFWEASKTDANKGEFFGVAIANIEKATRNEVAAVSNAYKAAVAAAKAPVKAYADGEVSKVEELTTEIENGTFDSLANAMAAADKYADVVALGEKMKANYEFGVKKYDDAKVDQAVKAAEKLVYADIKDGFKPKAETYITTAANNEGISLEAENYELQKFEKAIEDAAKKMYSDGLTATTPAVKEVYGDNKTPEADLVYLQKTYADDDSWKKIAEKAIGDLKNAQSYDEINTIMAKAAEDFGKLLKAADKDDVDAARTSYCTALENYGKLKSDLADATKYTNTDANTDVLDEFTKAIEQAQALVNKATTVAAVEAAYAEGQKIIDAVKTADELKAAKDAVEKQISELPYTSKLTAADKAAVKAAYEAYDAYMNMPGASDIADASKRLLKEKYNKVNELEAEAIEAKAKELNDKLDKLGDSDADVAAKAALKADVDAVNAEATALKDEIADVNDNYPNYLDNAPMLTVVTLTEADELAGEDMMQAAADDAYIKLVKAAKDGATVEEMEEALAAYNALTDKQKYSLDASALQFAKIIEKKLNDVSINKVETLKITTSTKLYKGSKIRVKWKVKGDASNIDGYQVYKSTKAQKGYKFMGKTKKLYMDNKKGLKKGTRYFYKVRAYKVIDGVKYYSDWSNKGNRIYKK